jgi:predicted enzyme related to lactoylglutathione lyase
MPDSKIITWFDIPAEDINRAVSFYNNVLGTSLQVIDFNGINMAMFSENPNITSGAIVQSDFNNPSETGSTVYFWVDDLDGTLSKVEGAGGIILQPKTKINDEHGFYGLIKDTEGNRVGLHGIS